MKKLFLFLFSINIVFGQTQGVTADKFFIKPKLSSKKAKFITDKIYAQNSFFLGSDTTSQPEPFTITTNARFDGKLSLSSSYGQIGQYMKSGGASLNPSWGYIDWTEIINKPSAVNSWTKVAVSGETILGIGNANTDRFLFSSNGARVGEMNQYGNLYGFTKIGVNTGFYFGASVNDFAYQFLNNYNLAVGGKAMVGYHTNMPSAQKTGVYFFDVAKQQASDISKIRFVQFNASGAGNVPQWSMENGINNNFSLMKLNTNGTADTTNSMYINAGRYNFGRSTGLNDSKFTFGGGATFLGNVYIPFDGFQSYSLQYALIERPTFFNLNNKISKDSLNISLDSGTGTLSLNGINGFSLVNFNNWGNSKYVTQSTAQNITGVKTFQHNTSSYMGYFNNTNGSGKGVKFTNTGVFPAIEVWQDLGETAGVQLWSDGSGDFANYLRTKYFQMSNGAGVNKILQSDASGFGSWVTNTSLPISTATQTALDLKLNISTASTTYAPITQPTFVTDATTPRLKITGAGDIGNGGALVMAGNSNDLTMHGTGKVILGTGGFQRLVVTNAGNVGVGTTAPVAKFEVSGLAGFRYNDGKQADGKYLRSNSTGVSLWDSVRHTDVMGLSSNYANLSTNNNFTANVGIGITPTSKVHALFGANEYFLMDNTVGSNWGIKLRDNSTDVAGFFANGNTGEVRIGGLSATYFPTFYSGGSERMRIDATGNIGIGTTAPNQKLEVANAGEVKIRLNNTAANSWDIVNTVTTGSFQLIRGGSNVYFHIGNTGNVGIGTTSPSVPLHVQTGVAGTNVAMLLNASGYGIRINAQTGGSGSNTSIGTAGGETISFNPNNAEAVRIIANGNIGIGTTAPNAPLQFGNSVRNRTLVLYEETNNDNQFYGFGINSSTLRYQVPAQISSHVFFAGTNSTSSQQLLSINGDQTVTYTPLTTTQINALTKVAGKMAYNSTTSKPVWCDGTTWKYADGTNM